MKPRIETLLEKKLVGKRITMSLAENKTFILWQSFMPKRKEINNRVSNDLVSMQVYRESLKIGDLNQAFEKWAAIEVSSFDNVPEAMDTFVLKRGLYAVFDYKGLSTDNSIFIYIFGTWLPNSDYVLDNRPHFEILGDKYKNGDPNSEEEIWIPIKLK
jgi:AraC family transcriptional regulator